MMRPHRGSRVGVDSCDRGGRQYSGLARPRRSLYRPRRSPPHVGAASEEAAMTPDLLILALVAFAPPTLAVVAHGGAASPLAHTYSIVARDSATGEMGVAGEAACFSLGPGG